MNRRQKSLLINFIFITTLTIGFIIAMVYFKDTINKSEAIRTMEHLSQFITDYRQKNRALPPKQVVDEHRISIGDARLGKFNYRAIWIDFDSTGDTILAYAFTDYNPLMEKGYIVMRLDGKVEWIEKQEFEEILKKQQTTDELLFLDSDI